jgi:Lon protease-like protein
LGDVFVKIVVDVVVKIAVDLVVRSVGVEALVARARRRLRDVAEVVDGDVAGLGPGPVAARDEAEAVEDRGADAFRRRGRALGRRDLEGDARAAAAVGLRDDLHASLTMLLPEQTLTAICGYAASAPTL